jgi:Arc/MetJ-type ribon-helix-helix transcriptional regulator
MAEMLLRLEGAQELVVEKLTKAGVFKNKTEVIRAGILELGKEYKVFDDFKELERELVERKLKAEQAEMKRKNIKYLSEKQALSKYR